MTENVEFFKYGHASGVRNNEHSIERINCRNGNREHIIVCEKDRYTSITVFGALDNVNYCPVCGECIRKLGNKAWGYL